MAETSETKDLRGGPIFIVQKWVTDQKVVNVGFTDTELEAATAAAQFNSTAQWPQYTYQGVGKLTVEIPASADA